MQPDEAFYESMFMAGAVIGDLGLMVNLFDWLSKTGVKVYNGH